MADESATDRQEAMQLSEDEDTIEFEIECVSSSPSSVSSRASSPSRGEQTNDMVPIESIQSESDEIISEIVVEQEHRTPPTRETSAQHLSGNSNEGQRLSSGPEQIPVDVRGGDSAQQAEASFEQQVAIEPELELTNEPASNDQIESPDVPHADRLSVGDRDLKAAALSVERGAEQSIGRALEEAQPDEPAQSAGVNIESALNVANEEASKHREGEPQPSDERRALGDWTLIADPGDECHPFEGAADGGNLSAPSSEAEPLEEQRKRQRLRASESDPVSDEICPGDHNKDHALYEPTDSMGLAPESATYKDEQQTADSERLDELAGDDDGGDQVRGEPLDGDILIQIEPGIPSLVEVQAGTFESDGGGGGRDSAEESSREWPRLELPDEQAAKCEDKDCSEFQTALSIRTTPTDEMSPNELAVDRQQVAWSDQLSSSSSLNNFLNLQDASATFEDEDLEREFDEEPEFKRCDVQVKRNQNPRDEYELGDELGRGKFGTVFRCVEKASGLKLAAKFMHVRRREDRDDVEREVAIMSELQHKRLLQLYDAFDDGQYEMCLITELVEGGELFERIVDDDFDLTEKKAAIFMRQICEGVEYMHEKRIVHLDMKPENILCLSRTGNRIKLIDFGLARRLDPDKPIRVLFGTPDFAAPEVLAYETVALETDMWSVGVICYVLLSGLSPFMGDSDMETMANVMRATFDFNDQAFEAISELAKDFIAKLLVRDPAKRLKPGECLRHAWLERGGRPLEAHIRERRKSSLSIVLEGHHRLALEQMAAAAALMTQETSPTTPPALPPGLGWTGQHFRPRPSIAESCASASSHQSLDKRRLKKYVVRRKWHKTVHAIMALGRMGANLRLAAAV